MQRPCNLCQSCLEQHPLVHRQRLRQGLLPELKHGTHLRGGHEGCGVRAPVHVQQVRGEIDVRSAHHYRLIVFISAGATANLPSPEHLQEQPAPKPQTARALLLSVIPPKHSPRVFSHGFCRGTAALWRTRDCLK